MSPTPSVLVARSREFEDLLRRSLYAETIKNRYNVDVAKLSAAQKKLKWSERTKAAFLASGQHWDDAVCRDVKSVVAQLVARSPDDAVEGELSGALDGLVMALEAKLS